MAGDKDAMLGTESSELRLRSPDGEFSKSTIWVESSNFYGTDKDDKRESYIIVGYDTEFKTPDKPVSLDEMKAGDAKYTVLSYQVHCSVYDPAQPDATEWSAICYPEPGERMKLIDILNLAF
ncbi:MULTISPECIES: hypothetical protein [unclassified Sphingomonas]|uniref:hypothetical protein n=1 Tax=unclassified Sphingomonas TaxID=196159 RepID=UPI00226AADC3|nr:MULTISPECIES: hypothetical protein [unclassified Sphingomonas]